MSVDLTDSVHFKFEVCRQAELLGRAIDIFPAQLGLYNYVAVRTGTVAVRMQG